ncbi:MAG: PH domain-containing protein [Ornithinimicrobium sp.]
MSDDGQPAGPAFPPPQGTAYEVPPPPVSAIDDWQRLSPRVMLLYPFLMAGQLIVPLALAFFFGFSQRGGDNFFTGPMFLAVGALGAVIIGVVPWWTTRFRLTDTQLQVRRGWLNRKLLTAPLDRVRSVDLESTIIHRVMRLSKVAIGTGVDSTRIDLNALSVDQAAQLQEYLLARKRSLASSPARPPAGREGDPSAGMPAAGSGADEAVPEQPSEVELARIDWSWLKYAPFSLASLVVVAGVSAFFWQFIGEIPYEEQFSSAENVWDWLLEQAVVLLVAVIAVVTIIGWLALSTLTYVISWWNLRLTRMSEGTLRLVRGLLTTNSTTIEEAKVRGVVLIEPALLRLVKGAELQALSTGVGDGGTTKVLPPCPRAVALRVGHEVLDEEGALSQTLTKHGWYARRRCHLQAQIGTLFPTVGIAAATWGFGWSWWIPVGVFVALVVMAVVLAEAQYRNLGHGLTEHHVMSGHGAFSRTREVLERAGVIGWVIRQSYFQRRLGLATLVATTAAGSESVTIHDIPLELGIALAAATSPEAFTAVT